jgi:hypothetical protein
MVLSIDRFLKWQEVISVQSNEQGILVSVGQNGNAEKILLINYSGKIYGTINIK